MPYLLSYWKWANSGLTGALQEDVTDAVAKARVAGGYLLFLTIGAMFVRYLDLLSMFERLILFVR